MAEITGHSRQTLIDSDLCHFFLYVQLCMLSCTHFSLIRIMFDYLKCTEVGAGEITSRSGAGALYRQVLSLLPSTILHLRPHQVKL